MATVRDAQLTADGPHATAALAFKNLQRSPEFRQAHPWVRHTLVCVESDLMTDVADMASSHGSKTLACYFPARGVFRLSPVAPGDLIGPSLTIGEWISQQDVTVVST